MNVEEPNVATETAELPEIFDLRSEDVPNNRLRNLLTLFPEVAVEGQKIAFDQLQRVLGEAVDTGRERYGMTWPGKADCFRAIQTPSTGTLRPHPDESVDFDETENLIIEGDNLEVLKLIQKAYLGKVKMIYIDPPYNTGNDFIYPDNYAETLQTYLEYTGQVDDEGKKFSTNTDTDGRFHSNWLNMMYPRLYLAKNVLRDDGCIFISIDDNEYASLRKLCDEIFGEENFVATFIWQKVYARDNRKAVSVSHDYILLYAKNGANWKEARNLLPREEKQLKDYKNPDNDPRGAWKAGNFTAQAGHATPNQFYDITLPSGKVVKPPTGACWRYTFARYQELLADNRIWFGSDGNGRPAHKMFLSEVPEGVVPTTWWTYQEVGHTQDAKRELMASVHFEHTENVFDTVKPIQLIRRMLQIATKPTENDIVLDFFAGSGSTGQAVLEQNADDGGNRQFVLVQLPEPLPKPEAQLRTITDITRERNRTVIERLNADDDSKLIPNSNGDRDRGFKAFSLSQSNFTTWDALIPTGAEALEEQLALHVDHIRADRSDSDLLYEVLLKSGFPLTTPVSPLTVAGSTVFSVADGALLLCLERELTLDLMREVAALLPERVVCLDEGFAQNDQLKANAVQIFKTKGVSTFKTV